EMGLALMGTGVGVGENRAKDAAYAAISSPLLEDVSIKGARGVLINITGGTSLSLHEVNEAATLIQEEADDDANIIFGAVIDEQMGDEVRITVIATGFGAEDRAREPMRAIERDAIERPDMRRASVVREMSKERRVVKLGTIIDEGEGARFVPMDKTNDPAAADSQYDVPTFLRKQAD
ncbi:MAG TPA: cell division protein FtsZ, partial [Candidatus Binatia bacterium]|nr:cell division protein FtsZ [Candidatus Binatia bacterium]